MKRKKKYIIILVILIVLGIFLKAKFSKTSVKLPLEKDTVKLSNIVLKYDTQGLVESKKIVKVFSDNIALVKKLNFRTGDQVKKGDVLAILENNISKDEVNLKKLKITYENYIKEYEDAKKIYDLGGISKNELESVRLKLEDAKLDLDYAKSNYKKFNNKIISPISGVIVDTKIDENYTIDNRTPLFTISDTENLQINIEILNNMVKYIKVGDIVKISSETLDTNKLLEGKIKSIAKTSTKSQFGTDNVTNAIIELNNFDRLKMGDIVEASVIYKNIENKLVVPLQYITYDKNNMTVVYVIEDNKLAVKNVKLGDTDGINIEVKEGLKENQVIVNNINNLYKVGDIIK